MSYRESSAFLFNTYEDHSLLVKKIEDNNYKIWHRSKYFEQRQMFLLLGELLGTTWEYIPLSAQSAEDKL